MEHMCAIQSSCRKLHVGGKILVMAFKINQRCKQWSETVNVHAPHHHFLVYQSRSTFTHPLQSLKLKFSPDFAIVSVTSSLSRV